MKCMECGAGMRKTKGDYRYTESGLDDIVLKNIIIHKCKSCGEDEVSIPATDELHKLIAFFLVLKPDPLHGKEVRFLRKMLGYTSEEFADALKVKRVTVSRWENSPKEISPDRDNHIRLFFLNKKSDELKKSPSVMRVLRTLVANLPIKKDRPEIKFQPEDWTTLAAV